MIDHNQQAQRNESKQLNEQMQQNEQRWRDQLNPGNQSEDELEKVTGNIPSIIAPDETPEPDINPTTPRPEIPTPTQNPDISPPAPSPINPVSPTELPPHIDPIPQETGV